MDTTNSKALFSTVLQECLPSKERITVASVSVETKDYIAAVYVDGNGLVRTTVNGVYCGGFPSSMRKAVHLLNEVIKQQSTMQALASMLTFNGVNTPESNDLHNKLQAYFANVSL